MEATYFACPESHSRSGPRNVVLESACKVWINESEYNMLTSEPNIALFYHVHTSRTLCKWEMLCMLILL